MTYQYPVQNGAHSQSYYAPTAPGQSYGPAGYYGGGDGGNVGNHAAFATQSARSIENFIGQAKRGEFQPTDYAAFRQPLTELQQHLPPLITTSGGMVDFAVPHAMVAGHGGDAYAQAYSLPTLAPLRTKENLTYMRNLLETMNTACYESSGSVAASGTGQPGAYHVDSGMTMRHSHSPGVQLPSSHNTSHMSQHTQHAQHAQHNVPVGTPDMTSGSSASNSSPGHSPSAHSTNGMSPLAGSMYPSLPATTAGNMSATVPASTLGNQYDHDLRHRHSGGMLQRAQPARADLDAMDIDPSLSTPKATHATLAHDPSLSNTTASSKKPNPSKKSRKSLLDDNIDPALAGLDGSASVSDADSGSGSATPGTGDDAQEFWIEQIRFLEGFREYVVGRLEREEYVDEDVDEESLRRGLGLGLGHGDGLGHGNAEGDVSASGGGGSLYPVLRS